MFFNDLFYHVERAKLNVYRDDHQIYVSNVDPVPLEDFISREVNIANQWYDNSMIVNET